MKDYDALVKDIEANEIKTRQMKNNLNALLGAAQQCDLFLCKPRHLSFILSKLIFLTFITLPCPFAYSAPSTKIL